MDSPYPLSACPLQKSCSKFKQFKQRIEPEEAVYKSFIGRRIDFDDEGDEDENF